jgi:RNA polymerase sigma factor (sigma-70 family)
MARKSTKLTATTVNSKLESLETRLVMIAKKAAQFSPDGDWEEMYQTILKGLLERNEKDAEFFNQTDAYICKYAEYMAKHAARKARVYLRYVDEEGYEVDPEDSNEDADSRLDIEVNRERLIQSICRVEIEVMHSELTGAIVEGCDELTAENLKVVYLLYMGYKQVEIAEIMGISKPAVSQRIKTIASTLQGFVADY